MAAKASPASVVPPQVPLREGAAAYVAKSAGRASTPSIEDVDLTVPLRTPSKPPVARSMYDLLIHEYISYLARREPVSRGARIAYFQEIEDFGRSIGRRWVERLVQSRPRLGTPLDVFKFLCKDAWTSLYGKAIDRLRTDHATVFQLHDNAFPLFAHLSVAAGATDGGRRQSLAMLAAGHLNGMLSAFGYEGHTVHSHVEGSMLKLEVTLNQ